MLTGFTVTNRRSIRLIYIVNNFGVQNLLQWCITIHPNSLHHEGLINVLTKSCYLKCPGTN